MSSLESATSISETINTVSNNSRFSFINSFKVLSSVYRLTLASKEFPIILFSPCLAFSNFLFISFLSFIICCHFSSNSGFRYSSLFTYQSAKNTDSASLASAGKFSQISSAVNESIGATIFVKVIKISYITVCAALLATESFFSV